MKSFPRRENEHRSFVSDYKNFTGPERHRALVCVGAGLLVLLAPGIATLNPLVSISHQCLHRDKGHAGK